MDKLISTIYFSFNAVFPILVLILLGYYAKCKGILTEPFIKPANKFNFRYGISMLMYLNIYKIEKFSDIPLNIGVFVIVTLGVLTAIGFFLTNILTNEVTRKGVIVQAAFRSNYAIIGVPLAGALAGVAGSALASAVQASTVIYYNLMSVLALSIYSDLEGAFDLKKVLKKIATNPLIMGLVFGVITLFIRQYIPRDASGELTFTLAGNLPWLYKIITYLANMSTPLALVILGAQFNFTSIAERKKELISCVILRIIGAPAIGFALFFLAANFGFITVNEASIAVTLALFGSPMAVSSVVMSSEMHADDILAGQIVVWTSLLSMGTIFLITCCFRFAGLL